MKRTDRGLPISNLDYWKRTVACSVKVIKPEDIEGIALLCVKAEERGEWPATWHQSAVYYGHLDKCQCVPCVRKRKESQ